MKKILFISHNAGRTGAPLMLLQMLRWFKENTDLSFEILLRASGPLQRDFESIAPTILYQNRSIKDHPIFFIARKMGIFNFLTEKHHQQLRVRLQESEIDCIYSNTFTNGDILQALSPLQCPVMTHVHEMEGWIQQAGAENCKQVLNLTSRFVTASQKCKNNLVDKHGVAPEKIDVVHSFIPLPKSQGTMEDIRKKIGISEHAFVVLGSGYECWRKGKDLFVELAYLVSQKLKNTPVNFIWVGGWESPKEKNKINQKTANLELCNRVHFVGEVTNPLDYFAAGDVFALVSREDTFPLVCLEAAALQKPILCFADAGGMPEFVENDAGFVVPYLDLAYMADRIAFLAEDEKQRASLGRAASEKVREKYNLATGARRIYDLINQWEG